MPRASPALPEVRAKTMTWVATCIPVVHIFSPWTRQPGWPSRVWGSARVSMWVASEPCSGSVRPKQTERVLSSMPAMNSSFWAWEPKSRNISTCG
ncbi:hypothetical protein D3C77_190410 [compost metagenome]